MKIYHLRVIDSRASYQMTIYIQAPSEEEALKEVNKYGIKAEIYDWEDDRSDDEPEEPDVKLRIAEVHGIGLISPDIVPLEEIFTVPREAVKAIIKHGVAKGGYAILVERKK